MARKALDAYLIKIAVTGFVITIGEFNGENNSFKLFTT